MKNILFAAVTILTLNAPAFASSCPGLMKKVDEALSTSIAMATITDANKTTVMELRARGDAEHSSGKHGQSVATLNEALKLLGK